MSRIAVIEYTSLDGVIQAPGHAGEDTDGGFQQGGWTGPFMAEHAHYLSPLFQAAEGFLLGRRTYDIWARYWPKVTDADDQIARSLNTAPNTWPQPHSQSPPGPAPRCYATRPNRWPNSATSPAIRSCSWAAQRSPRR